MNNLKKENIEKCIWHIQRHCDKLLNSEDDEFREYEIFHIQASIECLIRVLNNKKPYPNLDRDEVF